MVVAVTFLIIQINCEQCFMLHICKRELKSDICFNMVNGFDFLFTFVSMPIFSVQPVVEMKKKIQFNRYICTQTHLQKSFELINTVEWILSHLIRATLFYVRFDNLKKKKKIISISSLLFLIFRFIIIYSFKSKKIYLFFNKLSVSYYLGYILLFAWLTISKTKKLK